MITYLDYNAGAPLAPESAAAMAPWLEAVCTNPASAHRSGQRARAAVERARAQVASLIGCEPPSVVLTSGGTEADNAALWGPLGWPPRGHIVVSAVEHPAIHEPALALSGLGVDVTAVPVDADGIVSPDALRQAVRSDTRLVSIMSANNEVGSLQPVESLASIAHEAGSLFHTDAVQAAAWIDLHPLTGVCDLLSISSHKLAGPTGMGALYVRPGLDVEPLVRGGGQQAGRRGGTEATAAMVGFGAACDRALRLRDARRPEILALRDRLETELLSAIGAVRPNGARENRLPNTCHLAFEGCDGNALVARLDLEGIAASAGAACASGVPHGTGVLDAMGVPEAFRGGALRLSLGYETEAADVDRAVQVIPEAVDALRRAGVGALR